MEPDPPGNSQYRGQSACDPACVAVVTAGWCRSSLGVSEGRWRREGEAMCQRSMWKAVRVTPSDTHPSRMWTSRLDIESRSEPRSKIIIESRIQDRHRVGVRREALGCSAHVHRSQRRLRNSILSGRFRCKRDRAATDFAVPSVVRGRPAEVSILRLGGRCIDQEQAN
jgi:hypothetical protein